MRLLHAGMTQLGLTGRRNPRTLFRKAVETVEKCFVTFCTNPGEYGHCDSRRNSIPSVELMSLMGSEAHVRRVWTI